MTSHLVPCCCRASLQGWKSWRLNWSVNPVTFTDDLLKLYQLYRWGLVSQNQIQISFICIAPHHNTVISGHFHVQRVSTALISRMFKHWDNSDKDKLAVQKAETLSRSWRSTKSGRLFARIREKWKIKTSLPVGSSRICSSLINSSANRERSTNDAIRSRAGSVSAWAGLGKFIRTQSLKKN